ncbi:MAG: hypothetical protein U5P10_05070 [Spirochaetia bacterium]|nr:hypothetical protein [Spirochaetia bacterium]
MHYRPISSRTTFPAEDLVTDGFGKLLSAISSSQITFTSLAGQAVRSSLSPSTMPICGVRVKMTELQKDERDQRERHYIRKRISIGQSFLADRPFGRTTCAEAPAVYLPLQR